MDTEQEVSGLADAKARDATSVHILGVFWGKKPEHFIAPAIYQYRPLPGAQAGHPKLRPKGRQRRSG